MRLESDNNIHLFVLSFSKKFIVHLLCQAVSGIADPTSVLVEGEDSKHIKKAAQVVRSHEEIRVLA